MCHRWLLAVIMCILPWQPVYSLPLDVTSPSSEGFPTSQAPSESGSLPNVLPAPSVRAIRSSAYPVPKVQSVSDFQTFPTYVSHRVAFSKDVPPAIPSADDFPTANDELDEHGRFKRRAHPLAMRSVCDIDQSWRKRTWAIDILGENITVLSNITTNGNIKVHQWFYETTCKSLGHSCRGIDRRHFDSQCMTKKSWVFAMVRNGRGEEGWNWISIDTACNCGFRTKTRPVHEWFERDDDHGDMT